MSETITSPTPSGTSSNPNVTGFDKGLPLANGAVVTSIGVYSQSAQSGSVKIVREDSATNAEVIYSQDFSHPGTGWHDVSVASWTVPATGSHYVGSWLAGSAATNASRVRRYRFPYGNQGVGAWTGWDGDTGNLRGMRATGTGLTGGGGGGPPPADETWRNKTAGTASYKDRATGTPSAIVLFMPAWDDDKEQVLAYSQFENIPDCVLVSTGEPYTAGVASEATAIKAVVDAVKAEWGNFPLFVVGGSGGATRGAMFMARYPGLVRGAVLTCGIHDFIAWYSEHDEQAALEAHAGGPPSTHAWPYVDRSPRWWLDKVAGPLTVYVNLRAGDTVVPPHHQRQMYYRLRGLPNVTAYLTESAGNHDFDAGQAVTQISVIRASV